MTCHNRKRATLACLASLSDQDVDAEVDAIITDDGSTDGTAAAISAQLPSAQIVTGSGKLFWAGGMSLAEAHALRADYDYHVWLNDDVVLEPDSLRRLLATADAQRRHGASQVVVGSMRSRNGAASYGGVRRPSKLRPMRFEIVAPRDEPIAVETMNGNLVLVPATLARRLGGGDPAVRHGMADFDFGLRAARAGAQILVAPGWFGTCDRNPIDDTFRDRDASPRARWQHLRSQKGIPTREWLRFTRRHAGPLWPLYFISPYVRFGVDVTRSTVRQVRRRVGSE